jgi:hypothetical protein
LFAIQNGSGFRKGCGTTSALAVHQSRGQVAFWVRSVVVSSCVPGERALPVPPPLQVELVAPLGNRKLADRATGQPVPQFGARLLLQPRMLPPGYWLGRSTRS